jgi:NAD+ diphosphatase
LLDEVGGTLGTLDQDERVEAFFEIEPGSLPELAAKLERVESIYSSEIEGYWGDWGRFRAVIHRVTWEALGQAG